jgi:CubicO group peptidase (beta-lactamase class C family)
MRLPLAIVWMLLITMPGPAKASPPKLEGVWGATRHIGPEVRGPLVLVRNGDQWRAQVAQFDAPVTVGDGRLAFALPGDKGRFAGRLDADGAIHGHWWQPEGYASPVTLRPGEGDTWRGDIVPLDDDFTAYLSLSRKPDGSLAPFLRNPDRNLGRFRDLDRVEQDGDRVTFFGKRLGQGAERVFLTGEYRPDPVRLSVYFDERIGTLDLAPIEASVPGYFARGRDAPPWEYRAPVAVGDGWRTGTLHDAGMDAAPIAALVHELDAPPASVHDPDIHAVLVARHGRLVLEEYFHGFDRDTPHDTRSAGKVMATTLVGSLLRDHPRFGLSSRVYDIVYDGHPPSGIDPRKTAMTVEHLLRMSSGFDCDDWDGTRPGSEDLIQDEHPDVDVYDYTLALPMALAPGERAIYCSVNPNLVGKVVSVAAGRPLLELFDERVAGPLQIEHYWWNVMKSGEPYLGGGARFLPRDFMKFGQMMLDGGTWNGRRLLDAEFAARAGSARVELQDQNPPKLPDLHMRYGYLWWTVDYPYRGRTLTAYFASGNGGQEVVVIPGLDLVVATYGGNYADRAGWLMVRELIPKYILAAVKE